MAEIKAIETEYAGCRFRSRLEARWAVFFDHLKIDWQYESEGFETSAGNYLPDFCVDITGARWLEVKPPDFSYDARHSAFAEESGLSLLVATGIGRDFRSQSLALLTPIGRRGVQLIWNPLGLFVAESYESPTGENQINAAFRAARSARFGT